MLFEVDKDDLLRLTAEQLEELIARLAEAEIATLGCSPSHVRWSGSINAPDGGIDVQVQAPLAQVAPGFLMRPNTILQAKVYRMPKGEIDNEMLAQGKLASAISRLAAANGSYIIVSLGDDCSPPEYAKRIGAMNDAAEGDPNHANLHLDFYDRSKLAQWLRQHAAVALWVRDQLGQGLSGWRPYEKWSNPPQGSDDTLLSAPGITVWLPNLGTQGLSIHDAITPMRNLIRSSRKAIRITGLSGVGKTRIVQALFDESFGDNALDRTAVVYCDTGAEPDPSAMRMLNRLIAEKRNVILVVDNCPPELHSVLAGKVTAADSGVRLITVEYDIRDDKPQTTDVIHIEASGPELSEQLVLRRFPAVGQANANRIGVFSGGNARVALAIAERVEGGESLAQLSDEQLFGRLFTQRHQHDGNLRQQAEALSLVYSFSVDMPPEGECELDILAAISETSRNQLYRAVDDLTGRHIVQKRSHWRAILPHAVANRLTGTALNSIPIQTLRSAFETPGRERLLMSFAHRLGLMHDHPVAQELVRAWLRPTGRLGKVRTLNETETRMLAYVAPVAPDAVLDCIATAINTPDFQGMKPHSDPHRSTILNLLQSLAYDPDFFDQSLKLLLQIADYEETGNKHDAVENRITQFFQAYLSGTHATLEQRVAVVTSYLQSGLASREALALKMLSTALNYGNWTRFGLIAFGAHPRDLGYEPDHGGLVRWYSAFLDVARELSVSDNSMLESRARDLVAGVLTSLWRFAALRERLSEIALQIHEIRPWSAGWRAVRSIARGYTRRADQGEAIQVPEYLSALESALEPRDLVERIMAHVLNISDRVQELVAEGYVPGDSESYDAVQEKLRERAFQLGQDFAQSNRSLSELGLSLFSNDWSPQRVVFGKGLAQGSDDLCALLQALLNELTRQPETAVNFQIVRGAIEEAHSIDPAAAQDLLDQCASVPRLRNDLVGLHPRGEFSERDLDRCMVHLDDPKIGPYQYGDILWRDEFASLPLARIVNLAERLLAKPHGVEVVLEGLSMRLHGKSDEVDALGLSLRKVALQAAALQLSDELHDVIGAMSEHNMTTVVDAAVRFEGNEVEKTNWLDAIFAFIDRRYGYASDYEKAFAITAQLMPEEFLNRALSADGGHHRLRRFFISDGTRAVPSLSRVEIDTLIDWCRARGDESVWPVVASGIKLWAKPRADEQPIPPVEDDESGTVIVSEQAIRFLEAAPSSEVVLAEYARRTLPSSWIGSRTLAMQPRVNALSALLEHDNLATVAAAANVVEGLARRIEKISEDERRADREREQSFE